MKSKVCTILLSIFICQTLMTQIDSLRIAGLPFSSFLQKVDSLEVMKLDNDQFVLGETAYTLVTHKYWEFIGLKIEYISEMPGASKNQSFFYYKSKKENPIVLSERELFLEIFETNKSRIFQLPSLTPRAIGTSYAWTPIYAGKYLIIEKCEGFIGGQTSAETKFTYYLMIPRNRTTRT